MKSLLVSIIGVALLAVTGQSVATTSGVPGPSIKEGDRTWEYRSNFQDVDDSRPDRFDHRLHYQHAHNANHRSRFILQQSQREGDGIELVWGRFEHQWQYQKANEKGTTGAFRFDLQYAEGDNTQRHFARVGWLTDYKLGSYSARLNLFVGRDFGDARRSGISLASRAQFTRKISGYTLGLQMFNNYNTTSDMGRFNRQRHQVGPMVSKKVGNWTVFGSYLAGVTSRGPEDAFRLFLKRSL